MILVSSAHSFRPQHSDIHSDHQLLLSWQCGLTRASGEKAEPSIALAPSRIRICTALAGDKRRRRAMDLLPLLKAMAQNPARLASAPASDLREHLGSRDRKKRRTAANIALKFVRKVSTDHEGNAVWNMWDLSRLRGSTWDLPAWVRPGKGQYGYFDFGNITTQLDLDGLAAQLGDDDFDHLFGDGDGVRGVAIVHVGGAGVWWAAGGDAADFDLVFVTARGRLHLRPRYDGSMQTKWHEGDDLEGAGPSAGWRAAAWKRYHSSTKIDGFLIGGYGDAMIMGHLDRRAEQGGPDEDVVRSIALARSAGAARQPQPPSLPGGACRVVRHIPND